MATTFNWQIPVCQSSQAFFPGYIELLKVLHKVRFGIVLWHKRCSWARYISLNNLAIIYLCSELSQRLSGKESVCHAGNTGSSPGSGRSPGEGNDNLSSILAWNIPGTEEPGGLQSMGSQRVGHDLVTKQQQPYSHSRLLQR